MGSPQSSRRSMALILALLLFASLTVGITPCEEAGNNAHSFSGEAKLLLEPQAEPLQSKGWFTRNQGQFENPNIDFVYAGSPCSFGFTKSGYLVEITGEGGSSSVLKVDYNDAAQVRPQGESELPHRSNFFLGNDNSFWRTEVPNYERLVYRNLYEGIDLVFYTTSAGLKYDFLVAPGADPELISWSYEGAEDIFVDTEGRLHVAAGIGELVEEAPVSYQRVKDRTQECQTSYSLNDQEISFTLGQYERDRELVIDPLVFSTFVGGEGLDGSSGMVVDEDGNMYVTGYSTSADFPTTSGSFDTSYNDNGDVVIFKLSPDGSKLLYSTFVGGDDSDSPSELFLDQDGNIYVCGDTLSENFPTTPGCFDDSNDGQKDFFAFKLNPEGNSLIYSTFIGGSDLDNCYDNQLDPSGNVYLTGYSESTDFPVTDGCYDSTHNGNGDVVVCKLNSDGSELVYSTFVGGYTPSHSTYEGDFGCGCALDSANNIYVTGYTNSPNFPTTEGCYDDTYEGDDEAFVFKLSSDGSELIYSTFLGGENGERAYVIQVDDEGDAYVTGDAATDFPTTSGCYDSTHNGDRDGFITKLNADGTDLVYSTFIGGSAREFCGSFILDREYNAFITGNTKSENFPTSSDCFDNSYNGGAELDGGDGFLFKLKFDGSEMLYSSYLGGSEGDTIGEIELGEGAQVCMVGWTYSSDFPTTAGSYDESRNGGADFFACKFDFNKPPVAGINSISPKPALRAQTINFSASASDDGKVVRYLWHSSRDGELYNGSESRFTSSRLSLGNHQISLKVQDDFGIWSKEVKTSLVVHTRPTAEIDTIDPPQARETETVSFTALGEDDGKIVRYVWVSSIDGEFYNGSEEDIEEDGLSVGEHVITLKVQDDNGAWSEEVEDEMIILEYQPVLPNQKPELEIQFPSESAVVSGEIDIFGKASDDDGDIEEIQCSIDGLDWFRIGYRKSWSYSWDTTTVPNGEHEIRVRAFDGEDHSEEVVVTVTVDNKKMDDGDDSPGFTGLSLIITLLICSTLVGTRKIGRNN